MPTQQDILEDLIYQQGVSADTSRLVAEAFQVLIEFNDYKQILETKGFLVRGNEDGTYDLFDTQDKVCATWRYIKSANVVNPSTTTATDQDEQNQQNSEQPLPTPIRF